MPSKWLKTNPWIKTKKKKEESKVPSPKKGFHKTVWTASSASVLFKRPDSDEEKPDFLDYCESKENADDAVDVTEQDAVVNESDQGSSCTPKGKAKESWISRYNASDQNAQSGWLYSKITSIPTFPATMKRHSSGSRKEKSKPEKDLTVTFKKGSDNGKGCGKNGTILISTANANYKEEDATYLSQEPPAEGQNYYCASHKESFQLDREGAGSNGSKRGDIVLHLTPISVGNGGDNEDDPIEEVVDVPRRPLEFELFDSWTLWYRNVQSGSDWQSSLQMVNTFSTIEGFWRLYDHIAAPSELSANCEYALFREGVTFEWEHPANLGGGRWLALLNPQMASRYFAPSTDPVDVIWLNFLLYLIGESDLDATSLVTGAVVQIKKHGKHRMGVWCRRHEENKEASLKRVGSELRRSLLATRNDGKMCNGIPEDEMTRRNCMFINQSVGYELHDTQRDRAGSRSYSFVVS